ncbi:hypothetical protein GA0115233_100912 [Streptomyces sp. DI166]|uniref:hypothetical protein n=1 Tax=Streptomyces sp. DI166 TaxID=1839783 RepID=UPI0007F33AAB|nr:hypothetical protein [Streptomyces sp. DI166]SBT89365.1 hypothetical protein GA0115233_100912 [Streptomyces sp. DI166]
MPLPAGVETVTVSSGEPLTSPDGTLLEGFLIFTGPDLVTIGDDDLVLGGGVRVQLLGGEFSVELVATDATGMSPTGWTYEVRAELKNAPGWRRYISLPKATPGVVLADILVPDPVAGEYATLAPVDQFLAKAENLDDLPSASAARTNLGLGGAAVLDVGTTAGTVAAGDDARLSDARTPTAHADSHTDGGSDEITLTQDQITGLAAALAALLPLAGGTITGALTVEGYTTLAGGQFNSDFAAFGDMTLVGTGKRYRLRRSGDALDFEGSGVDMILSMWSAEDFTGTQRSYARLSADAQNTQWQGKFESVAALYGAAVHTLDPTNGVASLGGKNGLTALKLAGFKNSSGAPAAGTWEAGDIVLDSAGAWHLCTEAGTPGTWT